MNLIESIYKKPEDWTPSEYTFNHKSGANLWIKSGCMFCQPLGGSFSLINKIRAWRAFRWWCKNAPVEAFGGHDG